MYSWIAPRPYGRLRASQSRRLHCPSTTSFLLPLGAVLGLGFDAPGVRGDFIVRQRLRSFHPSGRFWVWVSMHLAFAATSLSVNDFVPFTPRGSFGFGFRCTWRSRRLYCPSTTSFLSPLGAVFGFRLRRDSPLYERKNRPASNGCCLRHIWYTARPIFASRIDSALRLPRFRSCRCTHSFAAGQARSIRHA